MRLGLLTKVVKPSHSSAVKRAIYFSAIAQLAPVDSLGSLTDPLTPKTYMTNH